MSADQLARALENLLATVRGDAPQLLDELRDGNAYLSMECDEAIAAHRAQAAQGEAVAVIQHFAGDRGRLFFIEDVSPSPDDKEAWIDEVSFTKLYASPHHVAQPLSDRAVLDLVPSNMPIACDFDLLWFARAIERAHGIAAPTKEQT